MTRRTVRTETQHLVATVDTLGQQTPSSLAASASAIKISFGVAEYVAAVDCRRITCCAIARVKSPATGRSRYQCNISRLQMDALCSCCASISDLAVMSEAP